MTQPFRLSGGQIDRSRLVRFQWNDRWMSGHPGDTLASALMANGVRMVGRSFKYHRPRGIFSAGTEEPNALVQLRKGAAQEPNTRATTVELFDGLYATSQNHRGSLEWDLLAINDLLAPLLSAGFYYKTFMWPAKLWEKLYEPAIRVAAGLGRLSERPDPDCYDRGFLHCDLLVIGGGPAGLAAALAAGRAGLRVIVADEDFRLGGRLNSDRDEVDGQPGTDWAKTAVAELIAMPRVRVMPRCTVYGAFDHGIYGALERMTDHLRQSDGKPRQVAWRIYAKRALLAAGATERAIAFGNNDRPGIMLAGAVRSYVNRFGVAPGRRVAVFTNNDDGLRTADDLRAAGIQVASVLDARSGAAIIDTRGRKALRQIILADGQRIDADCLAVSGGWSPNVHLTCHQRGRPVWSDRISGFVPGGVLPPGLSVTGAANGTMTLGAALREGHVEGSRLAAELGQRPAKGGPPVAADAPFSVTPIWHVGASRARSWVDLQNDVTTKDVAQAYQEGFRAVEHVKRYTTLGMATDQGRTSGLLGLGVLADLSGKPVAEIGTTMFRPPYTPVAIGAFAGRARGKAYRATRLTPSHDWATENGASFTEAGLWMRAQWFARDGEAGWRDSVDREVMMTRRSVGVCDVSTLGKIDIQGRDAAEFLNRVYANAFLKLPVGRVRYGLMLREDGFVYDDGTTARLAQTHFVMTTTTANAAGVLRHLEFARQCLWPDLDVHLISTTDSWAQFAVAGPNARALVSRVVDDLDLSNDAFPFMACAECTVFGGTPARLFRISFSGELAYEVAVPARFGDAMMRALMQVGAGFDAVAYGVEALGVMRIEKGHVAGGELNGQTTARMLGLGAMVSDKKDAIGGTLSRRHEMQAKGGLCLMGFRPVDRTQILMAGAHFLTQGAATDTAHDQGWLSSVAWSPELGHSIGLGFLLDGENRLGERIRVYNPLRGQDILVEVCSPHHLDPEGVRQRG